MENEMIERVARAIWDDLPHWERQSEEVKVQVRKEARAAIAAMRVPTEVMAQCSVNAGWSGVIEGDPELERERGVYLWQDMIDAALKSE